MSKSKKTRALEELAKSLDRIGQQAAQARARQVVYGTDMRAADRRARAEDDAARLAKAADARGMRGAAEDLRARTPSQAERDNYRSYLAGVVKSSTNPGEREAAAEVLERMEAAEETRRAEDRRDDMRLRGERTWIVR